MSPKLLMFSFFCFITGHIISLMLEGSWLGSTDATMMDQLIGYNITELSAAGIWGIPKGVIGFFTQGLPKLVTWDYSFLYGSFAILRVTLLAAISIGVVWGVTTTFASFIFGLARSII